MMGKRNWIPACAGTGWIPAFAGMTEGRLDPCYPLKLAPVPTYAGMTWGRGDEILFLLDSCFRRDKLRQVRAQVSRE